MEVTSTDSSKACFRFAAGSCQFGRRCRFSHDPTVIAKHLKKEAKKNKRSQQSFSPAPPKKNTTNVTSNNWKITKPLKRFQVIFLGTASGKAMISSIEDKMKVKIDVPTLPDASIKYQWFWKGDAGWESYSSSVSDAIEQRHVDGRNPISLSVGTNTYSLNTQTMKQTNARTGFTRDLERRKQHDASSKDMLETHQVTLTGEKLAHAFLKLIKGIEKEVIERVIPIDDELDVEFLENIGISVFISNGKMTLQGPASEVNAITNRPKHDANEQTSDGIPSYWKIDPSNPIQQIQLSPASQEFRHIASQFRNSCSSQIISIKRLQDVFKWKSYQVKKQYVEYTNNGDANEMLLFHGTSSDTISKILHRGFDRNFSGKNATVYGKGVYFAVRAAYSAQPTYSPPDNRKNQTMFVARVLVGKCCHGDSSYLAPPQGFHSVTDSMASPSMYVVFGDEQAYPEYIITFSDGSDETSSYNQRKPLISTPVQPSVRPSTFSIPPTPLQRMSISTIPQPSPSPAPAPLPPVPIPPPQVSRSVPTVIPPASLRVLPSASASKEESCCIQ